MIFETVSQIVATDSQMDLNERETKRFLAAKLFEAGKLCWINPTEIFQKHGLHLAVPDTIAVGFQPKEKGLTVGKCFSPIS